MPSSARRPSAARSARFARRGTARGFTLIEIVAAFAILALGLGLTMQMVAGSLRQTRQAADRTEASLWAKSLLDTVGVGERLVPGEQSGAFTDDIDWVLRVDPYEPNEIIDVPTQSAVAGALSGAMAGQPGDGMLSDAIPPVELLRLELVVSWGPQRRSQARFVTLRALRPEIGP